MSEELQQLVFTIALAAVETYDQPRDISSHIKKEMDNNHGHTWHCIVGKKFGSYVTHEVGGFIYFYIDDLAVLLFKTA